MCYKGEAQQKQYFSVTEVVLFADEAQQEQYFSVTEIVHLTFKRNKNSTFGLKRNKNSTFNKR